MASCNSAPGGKKKVKPFPFETIIYTFYLLSAGSIALKSLTLLRYNAYVSSRFEKFCQNFFHNPSKKNFSQKPQSFQNTVKSRIVTIISKLQSNRERKITPRRSVKLRAELKIQFSFQIFV